MKKKRVKKKLKKKRIKTKKRDVRVKYIPLKDLTLWDKNPRVNDHAADRLCGLIEEHGFINPIIVRSAGRDGYGPADRGINVGFRLARSSK